MEEPKYRIYRFWFWDSRDMNSTPFALAASQAKMSDFSVLATGLTPHYFVRRSYLPTTEDSYVTAAGPLAGGDRVVPRGICLLDKIQPA